MFSLFSLARYLSLSLSLLFYLSICTHEIPVPMETTQVLCISLSVTLNSCTVDEQQYTNTHTQKEDRSASCVFIRHLERSCGWYLMWRLPLTGLSNAPGG